MNLKDAVVILEVVKTRNISKAAANLFLAQSTVSTIIKQVEAELGCEIFYRHKGQRLIELTAAGKEFVYVARHIKAAQEKIDMLKSGRNLMLHIASNESFYYEILQPFCMDFRKNHPDVSLSIQVKDSGEIHRLIKDDFVELGFASWDSNYSGLSSVPVYNQRWVLLSGTELPVKGKYLDISCLEPEKECFYNAGDLSSIYIWRQKYLNSVFSGSIQTNSFIESIAFVKEFGLWELGTDKWAAKMQAFGGYYIYELETPPEERLISMLWNDNHQRTEIEKIFIGEITEWLNADKG